MNVISLSIPGLFFFLDAQEGLANIHITLGQPIEKKEKGVGKGLPSVSDGKEFACNAGDLGSISALGRPREKETVTHSSILALII